MLYIEVPFFTHQRITAPTGLGDRYTDEQRRDFARQVISWARAMRADEIFVEQYPEPMATSSRAHPANTLTGSGSGGTEPTTAPRQAVLTIRRLP